MMAAMEWTHPKRDDNLGERAALVAEHEGKILGKYVREIVADAMAKRHPELAYLKPRKPHTLQAWLFHDFAYANDWDELQAILCAKGYELAERGGGLVLCTVEGECICKASEIGQPDAILMKRFGAPFPGPAHRSLKTRYLMQKTLQLKN